MTISTVGGDYNYNVAWGDIEWKSMSGAFYACANMHILATDRPNLI